MMNEWRTPNKILEAARAALGGIDLDPASTGAANVSVRAKVYYSLERGEDGTIMPWHGRVWLNPPYGRRRKNSSDAVSLFTPRMIQHWRAGLPGIIIIRTDGLTNCWGTPLHTAADMLVIPAGPRIAFVGLDGEPVKGADFGAVFLAANVANPDALVSLGTIYRSEPSEPRCAALHGPSVLTA